MRNRDGAAPLTRSVLWEPGGEIPPGHPAGLACASDLAAISALCLARRPRRGGRARTRMLA